MLYALAHFLRDKTPWVWDLVNWINSFLFSIRYGQKLKEVEKSLHQERNESLKIVRLSESPKDSNKKKSSVSMALKFVLFKSITIALSIPIKYDSTTIIFTTIVSSKTYE